MKPLNWNQEKNAKLIAERGFSFEDIQVAIEDGGLLNVVRHSNLKRYPNQLVLLVMIAGYVYAVPFIERDDCWFLKTAYPSRKLTKKYSPLK